MAPLRKVHKPFAVSHTGFIEMKFIKYSPNSLKFDNVGIMQDSRFIRTRICCYLSSFLIKVLMQILNLLYCSVLFHSCFVFVTNIKLTNQCFSFGFQANLQALSYKIIRIIIDSELTSLRILTLSEKLGISIERGVDLVLKKELKFHLLVKG